MILLWFVTTFLVVSLGKYLVDRQIDTAKIRAELRAVRDENARLRAVIDLYRARTGQNHENKFRPSGYWKTLGIEPTRDANAIMKAFKAKAKKAHPDRGGSAAAFQALFEARNAALREVGAR